MINTKRLKRLRYSARVRSILKFKKIGNPETYAQFLYEMEQIGTEIRGHYTLLKFERRSEETNKKQVTARELLNIIRNILVIRGLPRYVAQIALNEEGRYKNLHLKSRIFVIWTVTIKYKKFLDTIRLIKISQFDIGEFPKNFIRAPFFPWETNEVEVWLQKDFFIIPNHMDYNLINLKLDLDKRKNFLIKEISEHESKLFWRILSEIGSSDLEKYLLKTPMISTFLTSHKRLKCALDVNSELTLDQVFESQKPIRTIRNAEIWHAIHIVKDGFWIIKDITEHPKQEFVAGHSHFASKNTQEVILAIPSGKTVNIESGFLLTKRCDENWYHFLLDLIPQVVFLKNLPMRTKIIVRDDLPETAKAILKFLQLNTIFISANSKVFVKALYYIPHRSSIFDTPVRIGNHPRVLFSEKSILKLRDRLKNFESENTKEDGRGNFFVMREGKYRNCINLNDVEQVLVNQGFRKFGSEKKYFKNQFKLFRTSDTIVLSGGAMAANMIFMKENASALVLGSWRSASLGLWSDLGRILGVKVIEVKGIPTNFSLNYSRRLHSNFFVPKVLLRYYLKR